jgi:hypothetical protein
LYYYRIRQVDFDGKSSYSKIIQVDAEIESEPIIHKLYYAESSSSVQVLQNLPGDVYFDMVDIHGRILYQNRLLINNEIPVYASQGGWICPMNTKNKEYHLVQVKQVLSNYQVSKTHIIANGMSLNSTETNVRHTTWSARCTTHAVNWLRDLETSLLIGEDCQK